MNETLQEARVWRLVPDTGESESSRFTVWAPFYEGAALEHFPVAFLLGREAE